MKPKSLATSINVFLFSFSKTPPVEEYAFFELIVNLPKINTEQSKLWIKT